MFFSSSFVHSSPPPLFRAWSVQKTYSFAFFVLLILDLPLDVLVFILVFNFFFLFLFLFQFILVSLQFDHVLLFLITYMLLLYLLFFLFAFRCKLLSLDDLWYGSQAIKIQIKKNNNNNVHRMHNTHGAVCTLKAISKHWQYLHCLVVVVVFCCIYYQFISTFLNSKIIEYARLWYAFARHALLLAFYEEKQKQRRTVKILKKQTHHLALEKNMSAQFKKKKIEHEHWTPG